MATPHAGSWFGLPDFGFTEALGGLIGAPRTSQGGSNILGAKTSAPSTSKPTTTNTGNKSGGSSSTGVKTGGSTPTNNTPQQTVTNYEDDARRAAEEAQRRRDEEIARERQAISSEFDPIFSELDRQIGMLPEQRTQFEQQISSLSDSQKQTVAADTTANIGKLDAAGSEEKQKAKSAFRDLEEDIRNQLQAREFYFGAQGAGDSSAPLMASEAITKAGLKTRGGIINNRDDALTQIELKKSDVNSLATEQNRKIDEWKSNKIFETVQYFTSRADELNQAKANASVEKQRAINDVIRGLQQNFYGRLKELDDSVLNFKSSVSTWQMQRQAELEDYQTKLGLASSYGGTGTKFADQVKIFNDLLDAGYSNDQAKQIVEERTGSFFTGAGEPEDKEEGGFGNLLGNVLDLVI